MKTCSKCKLQKQLTEFPFTDKMHIKRDTQCRDCINTCWRKYYQRHKIQYRQRVKKEIRQLVKENRIKVLSYLETHPCVDCGEQDLLVLDFDHRDPKQKKFEISQMTYLWKTMQAEIAKCDVVCGNCHRRRTAKMFGSWRLM